MKSLLVSLFMTALLVISAAPEPSHAGDRLFQRVRQNSVDIATNASSIAANAASIASLSPVGIEFLSTNHSLPFPANQVTTIASLSISAPVDSTVKIDMTASMNLPHQQGIRDFTACAIKTSNTRPTDIVDRVGAPVSISVPAAAPSNPAGESLIPIAITTATQQSAGTTVYHLVCETFLGGQVRAIQHVNMTGLVIASQP